MRELLQCVGLEPLSHFRKFNIGQSRVGFTDV